MVPRRPTCSTILLPGSERLTQRSHCSASEGHSRRMFHRKQWPGVIDAWLMEPSPMGRTLGRTKASQFSSPGAFVQCSGGSTRQPGKSMRAGHLATRLHRVCEPDSDRQSGVAYRTSRGDPTGLKDHVRLLGPSPRPHLIGMENRNARSAVGVPQGIATVQMVHRTLYVSCGDRCHGRSSIGKGAPMGSGWEQHFGQVRGRRRRLILRANDSRRDRRAWLAADHEPGEHLPGIRVRMVSAWVRPMVRAGRRVRGVRSWPRRTPS